MTPRTLLLVRHGLPDYRGGKSGDEPPGPPLSPAGWSQAVQAAGAVRPFRPERIHASPLARTWQTAVCLGRGLGVPVRCAGELREWHRTEGLYEVSVRLARWLTGWLRGPERCAVVVSHASPLLAILRAALYLPHVGWWRRGHPELPELASCDRLEITMASVFELRVEPQAVTAREVFHPRPRVHHLRGGAVQPRPPYPVPGSGGCGLVQRMNWLHLVGYRGPRARSRLASDLPHTIRGSSGH